MSEEQGVFSPLDQVKSGIVKKWELTEQYYIEDRKPEFIKATKSLARQVSTLVDPEDVKRIKEITKEETEEIIKIKSDKEKVKQTKVEEIDNLRYNKAEERLDAITEIITAIIFEDSI